MGLGKRRSTIRRALFSLSALVLVTNVEGTSSATDPAPALPSPPLDFIVTQGGGGSPWTLRIANSGELPVRIAADPRLLTLELTPAETAAANPKAKTAKAPALVRCTLPADTRPSTDEGRELVIPAKRSWSASFDPLFYCFGAKERAALVPGTTIKARFGWPAPTSKAKAAAPSAPFVAAPVGAALGTLASAKELEAAPFTMSEPLAPASASAKTEGDEGPKPPFVLSMPASLDVARATELGTSVTLRNVGGRSATLLFRPSTLGFSVRGPSGSIRCENTREGGTPIRELFSTVAPRGSVSTSFLLNALCPPDTFSEPGIYRVTPSLDTRDSSGRAIGIKTWDGEVTGTVPMLLRVRQRRSSATKEPRPSLD
ncbi:hypothetical protein AKJ09_10260 [Labilithrix luteola]|uniref:Uncharacterized protein n=1 Tax=Labilithrix luteola TaxID=1391654 RepID=A0A0K1QD54_9BACT|nr:hypothetical protein [Labilithrix luteola]AKV03597.1 hypothetical protein AKJ09_10260 [Labilithrix luteola]